MLKEKLPISVIIRTLNEESNIVDCIKTCQTNQVSEIIVSDGQSKDNTRQLAQQQGARVVVGNPGLAIQREMGVQIASSPYIAIIDADDRLQDDCLAILLQEMKQGNYQAIQAQIRNFYQWSGNQSTHKVITYWEKAMDVNMNLIRAKIGETKMVGRPALYEANALKQITVDTIFNDASEDSDLSYRFCLKNFKQGVGSGISYRKHLTGFKRLVKKWLTSGRGDAKFVYRHPERLGAVIKHQLYIYPIKRSWLAIKQGYGKYFPFFVLTGWFRFLGLIMTMIKIAGYKILRTNQEYV